MEVFTIMKIPTFKHELHFFLLGAELGWGGGGGEEEERCIVGGKGRGGGPISSTLGYTCTCVQGHRIHFQPVGPVLSYSMGAGLPTDSHFTHTHLVGWNCIVWET